MWIDRTRKWWIWATVIKYYKNSVGFDRGCFEWNCSMRDDAFGEGFCPDKYLQVHT